LGDFEKFFRALKPKPKFRLWLTTEPHPTFPSILLQQSLKVTYESPPGIKQNLLRTFESWDSAYFAQGSIVRAQILFVLAWFHAIVQERRTYIPQGFTKFYEFSFADLRSGADIINAVCARITDKSGALNINALPWPTIWGLMEQAIYGGRIDNDHDIRVVVTYLHKYFNRSALPTAAAPASSKLTVGIELPISNKYDDFMRIINALPNTDAPSVFTLAPNVEGAVQQTQSSAVVSQLRKLAVSSNLSSKFDREMWRLKLSPLLGLWEKLAVKSDRGVLSRAPKSKTPESEMLPVDSFVVLENNRVTDVLSMLADSLGAINAVVYGSGLLTPQIRDDALALLSQTVPNRWAKAWGGSEDPATYIREVIVRQLSLRKWFEKVQNDRTLSEPLNMALMFNARTFLNALRQQTSRAVKRPIDTLKLTCAWNPLLLPKGAIVRVEIEGLMLQGVGFDAKAGTLTPLSSDAPTLSLIPTATFAWIDKADPEPYPDGLTLPLYFSTTREEFICEVRMPAKPPQDQWILSGAALFLADIK
jgi:dynein heavy chain 2